MLLILSETILSVKYHIFQTVVTRHSLGIASKYRSSAFTIVFSSNPINLAFETNSDDSISDKIFLFCSSNFFFESTTIGAVFSGVEMEDELGELL